MNNLNKDQEPRKPFWDGIGIRDYVANLSLLLEFGDLPDNVRMDVIALIANAERQPVFSTLKIITTDDEIRHLWQTKLTVPLIEE